MEKIQANKLNIDVINVIIVTIITSILA